MNLAHHSIAPIGCQDQNIDWGRMVGNTNASFLGPVLPVMIVNGSREGTNTDAAASQVDHFTQEVFESVSGQLSNQGGSYNKQTDPNDSQGKSTEAEFLRSDCFATPV